MTRERPPVSKHDIQVFRDGGNVARTFDGIDVKPAPELWIVVADCRSRSQLQVALTAYLQLGTVRRYFSNQNEKALLIFLSIPRSRRHCKVLRWSNRLWLRGDEWRESPQGWISNLRPDRSFSVFHNFLAKFVEIDSQPLLCIGATNNKYRRCICGKLHTMKLKHLRCPLVALQWWSHSGRRSTTKSSFFSLEASKEARSG